MEKTQGVNEKFRILAIKVPAGTPGFYVFVQSPTKPMMRYEIGNYLYTLFVTNDRCIFRTTTLLTKIGKTLKS